MTLSPDFIKVNVVGTTPKGVHNKVGKVGTVPTTSMPGFKAQTEASSNTGKLTMKPNMVSCKNGKAVLETSDVRVGSQNKGK